MYTNEYSAGEAFPAKKLIYERANRCFFQAFLNENPVLQITLHGKSALD